MSAPPSAPAPPAPPEATADRIAAVGRARAAFADAGLAALWSDLDHRWDLDSGAYFTHPLALPVADLPRWAAAGGSDVVSSAQASAVCGYLHARILDDLVDGDRSVPSSPGDVLAASLLQTLHLRWLAEAAGPHAPDLLRLATRRWGAFTRAMSTELRTRRSPDPATEASHRRSLDRSRPLALPALAVRRRLGRPDAPLPDVVELVIDAHQRLTDLLDLQRDGAHGHTTWAAAHLRVGDGPAAAFQSGAFDRWLDQIDALHARAEVHAAALPGLGGWLARRHTLTAQVRRTAWERYLRRWLVGTPPLPTPD